MSIRDKYDLIFVSRLAVPIILLILFISQLIPVDLIDIVWLIGWGGAMLWFVIGYFFLKSMVCPRCQTKIMLNIMQAFCPKYCRKCHLDFSKNLDDNLS